MKSIKDVWKEQQSVSSEVVPNGFLNDENSKFFKDAFDENGKVTTKDNIKAFSQLVNIFRVQNPNGNLVSVVRGALRDAIKSRHDFSALNRTKHEHELFEKEGDTRELEDHHSLKIAELMAFSQVRFTGAGARNDMSVAGYDALTKMTELEQYRLKMLNGRAGGTGNLKTISLFKRLLVPPTEGLLTEATVDVINKEGEVVRDKKGNPVKRRKSMLEVFQNIQRLRSAQIIHIKNLEKELANAPEERKTALRHEIALSKHEMNQMYQQVAGQFNFRDNAMRHYANDHIARVQKLYKTIMGAEEINFDKFAKFDAIRGITFDRAEFQKVVQEDFLKGIRYAYNTYADLNYNQKVRSKILVYNPETKVKEAQYADMSLGESLFGYQIVNRYQFWKTNKHGGWEYDENGRHTIDWDKVQTKEGKQLLWKTWAMVKLGADLAAHRDIHSTDPAYNFTYYQDVLRALEAIPGGIWGDETDMTNTKVTAKFFTKEDMKWMKNMAKVEWWDLYNREFWTSMFMPKGDKKQGVVSTLLSQIVSGVGS